MSLRGGIAIEGKKDQETQVLITKFGETCFAFPVDIIRGTVPRTEDHSAQSVSAYDMEFPFVDLSSRSGFSSATNPRDPRTILCMLGDLRGAIPVDAVLGLIKLKQTDMRPLPRHFSGPERGWFPSFFLYQDSVALLINPKWVLDQAS